MNDDHPMPSSGLPSHVDLQAIARQVMIEHGFDPDFPPQVQQELADLKSSPKPSADRDVRDLRSLLWSSIDNDTSRDLDQVEVAEQLSDGDIRVRIGIADVDSDVPKASAIDQHAASQTTTVYTGVRNFSMIPETLSTGLTSLLENQDNAAVIIEYRCQQRRPRQIKRSLPRISATTRHN